MNKAKNILHLYIIVSLAALAGMSVYGAFIGPFGTKSFFNSPTLVFFWIIFVVIIFISLFLLANPFRSPGLFFMHAGIICIIIGSICGSANANKLMKKHLGIDRIHRGTTQIYKGQSQNFVFDADDSNSTKPSPAFKQLPFSISLKNFRIDFYEPGILYIKTEQRMPWQWKMEARQGDEKQLGDTGGTIKILKVFKNYQMDTNGTPVDRPQDGFNAAVKIEYNTVFGSSITKYIFEGFENPVLPDDKIFLSYKRPGIKNLYSDIEIIKDGKTAAQGTIAVNKPFHYGGFYFYQFDYDGQTGQFTVLQVVSDTGLFIIYAGLLLLVLGAFWHFWFQNIANMLRQLKVRQATNVY
jgi:hypothetical protein